MLRESHAELLDACKVALPTNFDPANANIRDDAIVPVDFTVGELRKIAAAIAKATGAA